MTKYLRLFKTHNEYEDIVQTGELIYKAHCIDVVHLHNNNTYYPGCEDGYPDDYNLDAGYYYQ